MKISSNGQVSIPKAVRDRWDVDRVLVIDRGDEIVMRPLPEHPALALRGKYADLGGPHSEDLRAQFREEEDEAYIRKFGDT